VYVLPGRAAVATTANKQTQILLKFTNLTVLFEYEYEINRLVFLTHPFVNKCCVEF